MLLLHNDYSTKARSLPFSGHQYQFHCYRRVKYLEQLLLSGADVFLKKPVDIQLCKAQATTLIQLCIASESTRSKHAPIIYGDEFVLIPRYRQVIIDGKFLKLTRKEYDLLRFFARHPNQIFTREQLYDHVWKNSSPIAVDESVKSQIRNLRKKLASIGKHYIQNEWGVGYKFAVPDYWT